MKKILLYIFLFLCFTSTYATHNRAGEITYRQLYGTTYEITLITYTNSRPGIVADRPELEIFFGDNTSAIVPRVGNGVLLPNDFKKNVYVTVHTYPGIGTYEIVMQDPNRNDSVLNIPGSVNVVFCIKTILQINSFIGHNNTPILLNPPLDIAAVGRMFVHNPGAYDPDGDSLSYSLTTCLGEDGIPIAGYTIPESSIDPIHITPNGDLVWNTPTKVGIYNIAMYIEEWRSGVKIGRILRDMQIEVHQTDNHPPVFTSAAEWCVLAGDSVNFNVEATDEDIDKITLTATGSPFKMPDNISIFKQIVNIKGYAKGRFTWRTTCSHIRREPHQVVVKAEDSYLNNKLVSFQNVLIRVIAQKPTGLRYEATSKTIRLLWDSYSCGNAKGFKIYRKVGHSNFNPSRCETGISGASGFKQIGTADSVFNVSYLDNNNGKGLRQGYLYCYRIVAFFADGAESVASDEMCVELQRGIPIMTHVSVEATDSASGEIYVAWAKPTQFDHSIYPGPYRYEVYKSADLWGERFVPCDTLLSINDTATVIKKLDTKFLPYCFKVEFWSASELVGYPDIASSVFLTAKASDNKITLQFNKNVPWYDTAYVVYRQEGEVFDSLAFTLDSVYTDNGLVNGLPYTYKVKSIGYYPVSGIVKPLFNYSQILSSKPIDTIPPCSPVLQVASDCENAQNQLVWNNPNDFCFESADVVRYNIYYSPTLDAKLTLVDSILTPQAPTLTSYTHSPNTSMAGCYQVTAVDSFQNESVTALKVCIDSCQNYILPNVFTPNGDNKNDLYQPIKNQFVDKIKIQIFNRWGGIVFETEDPEIRWDGKNKDTKQMVSDGVYYYVCDVYEHRLTGLEHTTLKGFIEVIAGGNKAKP